MSQDYAASKVPELKKLLNERGLPQGGNKAELIARLQENDKSMFHPLRDHPVPLPATATANPPSLNVHRASLHPPFVAMNQN